MRRLCRGIVLRDTVSAKRNRGLRGRWRLWDLRNVGTVVRLATAGTVGHCPTAAGPQSWEKWVFPQYTHVPQLPQLWVENTMKTAIKCRVNSTQKDKIWIQIKLISDRKKRMR